MAIIDLYSKRKKLEASQGKTDVYQYKTIPQPFRVQIVHIWQAALGRWFPSNSNPHAATSPSSRAWNFIEKTIAKENGLWNLGVKALANRTSRHGQGSTPTEVPEHFVAYSLHLALR